MEGETFYGRFMVKLVWLLPITLTYHVSKKKTKAISRLFLPEKVSLSILSPYHLHNFYI